MLCTRERREREERLIARARISCAASYVHLFQIATRLLFERNSRGTRTQQTSDWFSFTPIFYL